MLRVRDRCPRLGLTWGGLCRGRELSHPTGSSAVQVRIAMTEILRGSGPGDSEGVRMLAWASAWAVKLGTWTPDGDCDAPWVWGGFNAPLRAGGGGR
eukprot:2234549-Rhodomonas_salina.1